MKEMINNIFYLSILVFSFISCKTDTKLKSEYLEKLKIDKINNLGNRYLELNRFSGMILVTKNDNIIYNNSFGLADYENNISFSQKTTFKIGKITELFTANLIKKMAKNDKFQLSDKVSKYVPEIKSDITVSDILNKKIKLEAYSSTTGEKIDIDYNTLGKLIEKISGKSYQENIEGYCDDLKLKNTYFQKIDSTIAVGYLYNNYRGKGDELHKSPSSDLNVTFSSNGLKSTVNDLIKIINPSDELDIYGYLENDGFSYSLQNHPKNQITIIVLSNRRHPIAKEISTSIKQILQDEEHRLPLLRNHFEIDKKILKEYTGTYSINKDMNFDILNQNDSLFVILGSNKIHLIPQSENQFYMKQTDASMRFLKDSTNLVNEVVLLNGFLDGDKAKRIIK